jgi:PIN domain nuclease of toxin-antitoxin system
MISNTNDNLAENSFNWAIYTESPCRTKQSILQKARFAQLSITTAHALRAGLLPIQHRDPFERMIMAQSELEQIFVITYDPAFKTGLIEVIPE